MFEKPCVCWALCAAEAPSWVGWAFCAPVESMPGSVEKPAKGLALLLLWFGAEAEVEAG